MAIDTAESRLFDCLKEPFTAEMLFDGFHDTVYFIKNAEGEYVVVNQTLVQRCGVKSKSQLIGRTSEDVLRPPFGRRFTAQDRIVLQSGKPLVGQLELHMYASCEVGWCITSKYPLQGLTGKSVALVGVSRDLGRPTDSGADFRNVEKAIRFAESNRSKRITVIEMSEASGLSRFQLDRRMRIAFGLNTGQWLLKQRIDYARKQLQSTDRPIAMIALDAGYADQSAFSRQFRRATGMTPSQYRSVCHPSDC